ncbi:ISL3 family transposase [Streptomyces ehimensis]|uniref:ISL3 family transposase n=1 Tax=Streptomyces ehimensis TaxID=68195 RepID=UPI003AF07BA3
MIARFLAGRAGARLAGTLHSPAAPNTLLRRVPGPAGRTFTQEPAGAGGGRAPAPKRSEAPTVRQAVGWLTRHPDNLSSGQALRLKRILADCPELADLRRHISDFAKMMKNLEGHLLPRSIKAVGGSELPPLHSFARNLYKDFDAVTADLTLPYSSGMAEGHVNRVKFLKRQGYGRASFDLLRRRVLLTP